MMNLDNKFYRKGVTYGIPVIKRKSRKYFRQWSEKYVIFTSVLMEGEGCFSDIDVVPYQQVKSLEEIEREKG